MSTALLPETAQTFDFGRIPADYPGPWTGEPDKAVWVDETTDFDCMILRNRMGALCGYVAVPEGHPWFGVGYDDVRIGPEDEEHGYGHPDVHGGLTFADFCHEGKGDDAICHTPAPGRPGHVYWLGFDCAHYMDISPLSDKALIDIGAGDLVDRMHAPDTLGASHYRDVDYVVEEVRKLALQAKLAGSK